MNSGVSKPFTLANITEEHYDKTFDLSARSTLHITAKKALTLMTEGR